MRILIAEDEPLVALALAGRLRGLGHEVDGPYPDGRAAFERALVEPPTCTSWTSGCRSWTG